jgi:beta-glucanase (GH16 family)
MKTLAKQYLHYFYIILLIISTVTLTYCSNDKNNSVDENRNNDSLNIVGYNLVWNDEFEGTKIDDSKWSHLETGNPANNELQYYTPRSENSYVINGSLYLVARSEQFTGPDGTRHYTSARLNTKKTKTFQYGKITARIKLPYGQGIWPAFWMLGSNIDQVGWPKCGEIDIMEMIGGGEGRDNATYGTLHWDSNGHRELGGSKELISGILNDDFHEFTINWDSEKVEWLLDNKTYNSLDITDDLMSEFHQHFFIILNLAVGGNWPGDPTPQTVFPQEMVVDYVRVYQKED